MLNLRTITKTMEVAEATVAVTTVTNVKTLVTIITMEDLPPTTTGMAKAAPTAVTPVSTLQRTHQGPKSLNACRKKWHVLKMHKVLLAKHSTTLQ